MKKLIAGLGIASLAIVAAAPASAATITAISGASMASITRNFVHQADVSSTHTANLTGSVSSSAASGSVSITSNGDQAGSVIITGGTTTASSVDHGANSTTSDTNLDSQATSGDQVSNIASASQADMTHTDVAAQNVTHSNSVTEDTAVSASNNSGSITVASAGKLADTGVQTGTNGAASQKKTTFNIFGITFTRSLK